MEKIVGSTNYFFLKDLLKIAKKNGIGHHTVDAFIEVNIKKGVFEKDSNKLNGGKGAPHRIIRIISAFETRCESCFNIESSFYCSNCSITTCKHKATLLAGLFLCPICNDDILLCYSCLTRKLGEFDIQDLDLEKCIMLPTKITVNTEIKQWRCISEDCEDYSKNLDFEEIEKRAISFIETYKKYRQEMEMLEYELEEESRMEKAFQEKMQEYLNIQGTPLRQKEECVHRTPFCKHIECPISFYEEDQITCPSGLAYYHEECQFCEECDYLKTEEGLDPWDNEYTTRYCEFLGTFEEEEEELE